VDSQTGAGGAGETIYTFAGKLINDDIIIRSLNSVYGAMDNNHKLLKDRPTAYFCPTQMVIIDSLILKSWSLEYILYSEKKVTWGITHTYR